MFKLCIALCVVATLASEAPVVTLQLDGEGLRSRGSHYAAERKANTAKVHECPAGNGGACKLPEASAFDHHDTLTKDDIKRQIIWVEKSFGQPCKGRGCACTDTEKSRGKCDKFVNPNKRGTYVADYKLCDASNNCADRVTFAVIFDDKTAPRFDFRRVSKAFHQECRKTSMTIPMPTVKDNQDGYTVRKTLRINGKTSQRKSLFCNKKACQSTRYAYEMHDFAGIFGVRGRNNQAKTIKTFLIHDHTRPTIEDLTIKAIECAKGTFFKLPTTKCNDKCDVTKDVGACSGSGRRSVRIAGKYTHFNSGRATGCEHRNHYLYDYKGSDCVWTSNPHKLKTPHAFQNAFLKFQMAEYGTMENEDYIKIQLKFYGTSGTTTDWIDTVKLQDDVLGWVWTTVYDAPGYGYFSHRGRVNKDWQTFNAVMQKNHASVQIRVILRSSHDHHERHILDNLEVFGSECMDFVPTVRTQTVNVDYTCKDQAGHSALKITKAIKTIDTTPPTIKVNMGYVTYKSEGTWAGKIFTHHGGHKERGFAPDGKPLAQHSVFSCGDTCCSAIKESHKWVKSCAKGSSDATWNELVPGTYYHKFTCTDCNKLETHGCRTIINVDKYVPIITVLGGKDASSRARPTLQKRNTIEATHDKNYVDNGATCSDQVDGVISKEVGVSGDVVNMAKPGMYHITYSCCDIARNCAKDAIREVKVQDTTCPTCKITGGNAKREASFTYKDAGATCTDSLDGTLKAKTTGRVNTEATGTYTLTYSTMDAAKNTNTGGNKCKGGQKAQTRQVIVADTLKPVIALHFGGKKIHVSGATDTGLNKQRNPAATKFMAESSSVNGWIIAAVGSAVAGVALLALGSKTTQVSVPV